MIPKLFVACILVTSVITACGEKLTNSEACDFPAIYNFGDSNSDTGGISAAFYPIILPCGETFFGQAAGRGSDGRLIIDFIAQHLKLPYLSPYLDSLGDGFRHGANFATGGSTIRRQNESVFENGVSPFPLDIQVVQFNQLRERSRNLYKKETMRERVPRAEEFSKALYTLDIGQNDLAAGFRKMYNKQFVAVIPDIIDQFAAAIQKLYEQGARAFWIHNTGPIGCLAVTMRYIDNLGCAEDQNEMAIEFNRQLKDKVIKLRPQLHDAQLTYVDVFAAKYKLITDAKNQGFLDKGTICCGYHEDNNHVWCGNKGTIKNGTEIYAGSCADPTKVISWDGVHYTEAANSWISNHILNGSFSDPPLPISHSCPWSQIV